MLYQDLTVFSDTLRQWNDELTNKKGLITFPNSPFFGLPHYNLNVMWQVKAGYDEVILVEDVLVYLQEYAIFYGNDYLEVEY